MSGSLTIQVTKDDLTPSIHALLAKSKNLQPALRTVAAGLVSLAKQSFNDSSKRPAPWKAKKDGTPATLKGRNAVLWRSLQATNFTTNSFTLGSPLPYAAIHQLGGLTRKMPARPYWPILNGQLTPLAVQTIEDILEAYLKP